MAFNQTNLVFWVHCVSNISETWNQIQYKKYKNVNRQMINQLVLPIGVRSAVYTWMVLLVLHLGLHFLLPGLVACPTCRNSCTELHGPCYNYVLFSFIFLARLQVNMWANDLLCISDEYYIICIIIFSFLPPAHNATLTARSVKLL